MSSNETSVNLVLTRPSVIQRVCLENEQVGPRLEQTNHQFDLVSHLQVFTYPTLAVRDQTRRNHELPYAMPLNRNVK